MTVRTVSPANVSNDEQHSPLWETAIVYRDGRADAVLTPAPVSEDEAVSIWRTYRDSVERAVAVVGVFPAREPVPSALALQRIEDAVIEDILAIPGGELRQELAEAGEDPAAMVREVDKVLLARLAARFENSPRHATWAAFERRRRAAAEHGSIQVDVGVAARAPASALSQRARGAADLASPDGGLDRRGLCRRDALDLSGDPGTDRPDFEIQPAPFLADEGHADVQAGEPVEGVLHEVPPAEADGHLRVGRKDRGVTVSQVGDLDPSHQEIRFLAGDPGGDVGGLGLDGARVACLGERMGPSGKASHADGDLVGGAEVFEANGHAGDSEAVPPARQARTDAEKAPAGGLPVVWSAW